MVRNRLPVGLLSEATGGNLAQALRYRELIGPAGFGYELRGALSTGTELWGGLCLTREKGRSDFESREVAFIRRIIPHLGAGLRAATLHQQLLDDQDSDDAGGVLVLDQRGTVVQHNAAAERRLRELGELGPRWREGEGLPIPIWTVFGALERALKPETDLEPQQQPSPPRPGTLGPLAKPSSLTHRADRHPAIRVGGGHRTSRTQGSTPVDHTRL